jgi:hypothetical protein
MGIGVHLSTEDLDAVRELYGSRWGGDISNWKERGTDYCLWKVSCPDDRNRVITETGRDLSEVIGKLLSRIQEV